MMATHGGRNSGGAPPQGGEGLSPSCAQFASKQLRIKIVSDMFGKSTAWGERYRRCPDEPTVVAKAMIVAGVGTVLGAG